MGYAMKTDDELNYENGPRQMLSRVMRIGQILAGSLAQQSKPIEKLNDVHPDSHSLENHVKPQADDVHRKTNKT
jgi:hypothetical protein